MVVAAPSKIVILVMADSFPLMAAFFLRIVVCDVIVPRRESNWACNILEYFVNFAQMRSEGSATSVAKSGNVSWLAEECNCSQWFSSSPTKKDRHL